MCRSSHPQLFVNGSDIVDAANKVKVAKISKKNYIGWYDGLQSLPVFQAEVF